jgi:hypothetical protein
MNRNLNWMTQFFSAMHAQEIAREVVGCMPPLTPFFSLPDKFLTVSFFSFSLPTFIFPVFFALAFLDFVTIVFLALSVEYRRSL